MHPTPTPLSGRLPQSADALHTSAATCSCVPSPHLVSRARTTDPPASPGRNPRPARTGSEPLGASQSVPAEGSRRNVGFRVAPDAPAVGISYAVGRVAEGAVPDARGPPALVLAGRHTARTRRNRRARRGTSPRRCRPATRDSAVTTTSRLCASHGVCCCFGLVSGRPSVFPRSAAFPRLPPDAPSVMESPRPDDSGHRESGTATHSPSRPASRPSTHARCTALPRRGRVPAGLTPLTRRRQ